MTHPYDCDCKAYHLDEIGDLTIEHCSRHSEEHVKELEAELGTAYAACKEWQESSNHYNAESRRLEAQLREAPRQRMVRIDPLEMPAVAEVDKLRANLARLADAAEDTLRRFLPQSHLPDLRAAIDAAKELLR